MNYQFSPHNPHLNHAYALRAKLRSLQAGEKNMLAQIVLGIRYRWHEALAGKDEKLPR